MNDLERNYYNVFGSVHGFGADNATDFKAGSAGAKNFAAAGIAVGEMEQSGAVTAFNASSQITVYKYKKRI